MFEPVCVVYDLDGMVLVTIYFFKIMFYLCLPKYVLWDIPRLDHIEVWGLIYPLIKYLIMMRVFVKLKVKFE